MSSAGSWSADVRQVALVLAVLGVATALGLWWRSREGRVRVAPAEQATDHLTAADVGVPLGVRATYLQLSSEHCTACRRTHRVLEDVARSTTGVVHLEVDVAQRMDLVSRFDVLRTPTVLVLDAQGTVVARASGAMDRAQALAALDATTDHLTREGSS
jgi:thiol-disulfide isomerase/thioredoxin